jgi:hypothetical protein
LKSRENDLSRAKLKSASVDNVCATIDDFYRRFFGRYRARLSFTQPRPISDIIDGIREVLLLQPRGEASWPEENLR